MQEGTSRRPPVGGRTGSKKATLKRTIMGAVLGATPGGILLLWTVPVSGEGELTLGVMGILLAFWGGAVGALAGALWR
ncbi:MAG: hypothetical protein HY683_01690 [Chloroflexi bacterium]|nr:hypothetical protein [Chloroflexota bacterium]